MYRLCKIVSFASRNFTVNKIAFPTRAIGWQRVTSIQRFHTKHKDCSSSKGGKVPKKCEPEPATGPPKCKPYPTSPCRPPTQSLKYPRLQECPKPNLMSETPQPDPCEDDNKNRRNLIIGLLVAAATLGALYLFLNKDKTPPKAKVSKKIKPRKVIKNPAKSSEIPNDVPYLLIGGGTASFSAFRAIKSADPKAKVLIISNEENYPYMRPPLSKELWFNDDVASLKKLEFKQWNGAQRSLFYEPSDFYLKCKDLDASENGGVAVARGWSVKRIDVVNKIAILEDSYEIKYNKCLIATGALPKNLNVFEEAAPNVLDRVTLYRDVFNFEELHEVVNKSKSIAIVGGGFLGSELACALGRKGRSKNLQVYQIFKEKGNMGKILPEYLSLWTTDRVKAERVDVLPSTNVISARSEGNHVSLDLSGGKTIKVDHVIVSVGVEPNTEFAENSDLEVDCELGGYLVNTELQARSHLFAAGDCACFYDPKFGRRRIEHHDHAVVSGRLAGENMTGCAKPYLHQSMFWSDLGPDIGYEAIGVVDAALPTVGVFAKATEKDNPKAVVTATNENIRSNTEEIKPRDCKKYLNETDMKALETENSSDGTSDEYGKGVIFYLRNDIVVGIVLWNVFNRMSVARQVLKEERKYEDLNEVAKLFSIHEE